MHKRNALSLAIAMACAFSAAAQQAEDKNTATTQSQGVANETELEVISVTATKRKTKLMETPVAISALSEAQLQQSGVNNVVDIANLVPGLDIAVSSEQAAPVIPCVVFVPPTSLNWVTLLWACTWTVFIHHVCRAHWR